MTFEYTPPWEPWSHFSATPVVVDLEGVDPNDFILRTISRKGTFYEAELLEYLFMRGPRGGLYIDVGAHLGNHSVYFGKFLADAVVAVEPSPVMGPLLRRNLLVNGVRRALVFECAAARQDGRALHYQPAGFPQNTGAARLAPPGSEAEAPDGVLVPTTTLNSLLLRSEAAFPGLQVSLIKLDIEGMETEALLGAMDALEKHKPQLVVELATPDRAKQVAGLLNPLGYRPVGCFCATPTYHFIDRRVHSLRRVPPKFVVRVGNSWRRGRLRALRARLRRAVTPTGRTG